MKNELWKKLLRRLQDVGSGDTDEEIPEEALRDRELIIDEEDKEQRVRIRGRLPRFYWVIIGNIAVFAVLAALYVTAGLRMYSPSKAVEEYYAAYVDGDWNAMYDACTFPESEFLSRQSFVNANSYQGIDGEAPETVIGFTVKPAQESELSRTYQVDYRVSGSKETKSVQVETVRGARAGIFFRTWEVIPDGLYMENVEIQIPAGAKLTLDGIGLSSEFYVATDSNVDIYRIPYLFCGYHTIALEQEGKEEYREIYKAEEGQPLRMLPDLRLSETTGKEITEFVLRAVDAVYEAAISHGEFESVSEYFPSDVIGKRRAEDAYGEFTEHFAGYRNKGVTKLAIRQMDLSVSGEGSSGFDVTVDMTFNAEEASRAWKFRNSTKTYSGTSTLTFKVYTNENELKLSEGIFGFFENMEQDEEEV